MTLLGIAVVVFVAILLMRRFRDVPLKPDKQLEAQRQEVRRALESMKKRS